MRFCHSACSDPERDDRPASGGPWLPPAGDAPPAGRQRPGPGGSAGQLQQLTSQASREADLAHGGFFAPLAGSQVGLQLGQFIGGRTVRGRVHRLTSRCTANRSFSSASPRWISILTAALALAQHLRRLGHAQPAEQHQHQCLGPLGAEQAQDTRHAAHLQALYGRLFRQGFWAVLCFGQLQRQLAPAPAVVVDQLVAGDAEQPGGKAALPAKVSDRLPGGQEGLRGQVLGLLHLPGARQVIAVDARQVALVQLAEGFRVASGMAGQLGIVRRRVAIGDARRGQGQEQGEWGGGEHTEPMKEQLRCVDTHMSLHLPKR